MSGEKKGARYTIKIYEDTKEALEALKEAWGLKSIDEVIKRLIEICGEQCKKAIVAYREFKERVRGR
jgi:predicted CopG family antitoxin